MADVNWYSEDFSASGFPEDWDYDMPSPPANYPKLIVSQDVSVVGEQLVVQAGEDAEWAGAAFAVNGWTPEIFNYTPNANRDVLFLAANVTFTEAYLNAVSWEAYIFNVFGVLSSWPDISVGIRPNDPAPGQHTIFLKFVGLLDGDYEEYEYATVVKTTAELVTGSPILVRLEWQGGTFNWEDFLAANDGYVTLSFDGVPVYDVQDVPQIVNYSGSTAERCSQYTVVGLGYYGMPGIFDNFRAGYVAAGPEWVDIANFIDQELNSEDFENKLAKVVVDAWAGENEVEMQVRLFNVTLAASAGESAAFTSAVPVDATFTATLAMGRNVYRLQVGSYTPDVDLFAVGTIYRLEA